jgi:hypothetical protein
VGYLNAAVRELICSTAECPLRDERHPLAEVPKINIRVAQRRFGF